MRTENDRFRQIREDLNLSQRSFASKLGVKQAYISAIEIGKREVTSEIVRKLIAIFRVSANWLYSGEGEKYTTLRSDETPHEDEKDAVLHRYNKMSNQYVIVDKETDDSNSVKEALQSVISDPLRNDSSKQKMPSRLTMNEESPSYLKNNLQILPIVVTPQNTERIVAVPFFAEAGYTRGFQDTGFIQDLPHFSLPQLGEGTYRAFQIRGDSMESSLNSGDWVVGRYVDRVQGLQAGTICVVLLKDEGILCKRVEKRGKMGVMLHSNNPRYSPIEPESENILEMWEVRAVLRYLF